MIAVTAAGWEIIDRCEAATLTMVAWARLAMKICSAGGSTLSSVPTSAHEGTVFHATGPDGSFSPNRVIGRWVAAKAAPTLAGRSLAKHCANPGYGSSATVFA